METAEVITKTKWAVDPSHTEIGFKIRHLMISHVKGIFREFDAKIFTSGKDFTTADIEFWIDTASIDTRDEKRNAHLKGPDFFDAEKFPKITFVGSRFEKIDRIGGYYLHGQLTMKGITNKIKLDVQFGGTAKDPWGNEKAGFSISGRINRKDWGLTWNTATENGSMVGDEVNINCELQLTKQKE